MTEAEFFLPPFLMLYSDDSPPTFEVCDLNMAYASNASPFWSAPKEIYDPYVARCRSTGEKIMSAEEFSYVYFADAEESLREFERDNAMQISDLLAHNVTTMRGYSAKMLMEKRDAGSASGSARPFSMRPPPNFNLAKALELVAVRLTPQGSGPAAPFYNPEDFVAVTPPSEPLAPLALPPLLAPTGATGDATAGAAPQAVSDAPDHERVGASVKGKSKEEGKDMF